MNASPRLSSTLLKGYKNDFRDAEAIAEAVQRPTMQFVGWLGGKPKLAKE